MLSCHLLSLLRAWAECAQNSKQGRELCLEAAKTPKYLYSSYNCCYNCCNSFFVLLEAFAVFVLDFSLMLGQCSYRRMIWLS